MAAGSSRFFDDRDDGRQDGIGERLVGPISLFSKLSEALLVLAKLILAVLNIRTRVGSRTIKPNHIYTTRDVAAILDIGRRDVIGLIHAGKIEARKTGRNYLIVGGNIIRYLRG
ncbi:MAG: helix-turn-helix domain-containing protein [Alphaproteobacteria bacterium]|nr:helix-turn-helix domain-containing protein [Alphaproteobacteria bacterium]MBF0130642.1 helix-turn-helix domain-containing protein [Alphaproteobacteria bacterium]